ncbi:uncharacterized protein LOC135805800 isoform X1 [Sycon ciliatum]|uniref:uncharacterized protein LOC135805800 isoform X1 n=1 Tax=Sycon ciliatum TaxID=27933 RepID=UPI0031F6D781
MSKQPVIQPAFAPSSHGAPTSCMNVSSDIHSHKERDQQCSPMLDSTSNSLLNSAPLFWGVQLRRQRSMNLIKQPPPQEPHRKTSQAGLRLQHRDRSPVISAENRTAANLGELTATPANAPTLESSTAMPANATESGPEAAPQSVPSATSDDKIGIGQSEHAEAYRARIREWREREKQALVRKGRPLRCPRRSAELALHPKSLGTADSAPPSPSVQHPPCALAKDKKQHEPWLACEEEEMTKSRSLPVSVQTSWSLEECTVSASATVKASPINSPVKVRSSPASSADPSAPAISFRLGRSFDTVPSSTCSRPSPKARPLVRTRSKSMSLGKEADVSDEKMSLKSEESSSSNRSQRSQSDDQYRALESLQSKPISRVRNRLKHLVTASLTLRLLESSRSRASRALSGNPPPEGSSSRRISGVDEMLSCNHAGTTQLYSLPMSSRPNGRASSASNSCDSHHILQNLKSRPRSSSSSEVTHSRTPSIPVPGSRLNTAPATLVSDSAAAAISRVEIMGASFDSQDDPLANGASLKVSRNRPLPAMEVASGGISRSGTTSPLLTPTLERCRLSQVDSLSASVESNQSLREYTASDGYSSSSSRQSDRSAFDLPGTSLSSTSLRARWVEQTNLRHSQSSDLASPPGLHRQALMISRSDSCDNQKPLSNRQWGVDVKFTRRCTSSQSEDQFEMLTLPVDSGSSNAGVRQALSGPEVGNPVRVARLPAGRVPDRRTSSSSNYRHRTRSGSPTTLMEEVQSRRRVGPNSAETLVPLASGFWGVKLRRRRSSSHPPIVHLGKDTAGSDLSSDLPTHNNAAASSRRRGDRSVDRSAGISEDHGKRSTKSMYEQTKSTYEQTKSTYEQRMKEWRRREKQFLVEQKEKKLEVESKRPIKCHSASSSRTSSMKKRISAQSGRGSREQVAADGLRPVDGFNHRPRHSIAAIKSFDDHSDTARSRSKSFSVTQSAGTGEEADFLGLTFENRSLSNSSLSEKTDSEATGSRNISKVKSRLRSLIGVGWALRKQENHSSTTSNSALVDNQKRSSSGDERMCFADRRTSGESSGSNGVRPQRMSLVKNTPTASISSDHSLHHRISSPEEDQSMSSLSSLNRSFLLKSAMRPLSPAMERADSCQDDSVSCGVTPSLSSDDTSSRVRSESASRMRDSADGFSFNSTDSATNLTIKESTLQGIPSSPTLSMGVPGSIADRENMSLLDRKKHKKGLIARAIHATLSTSPRHSTDVAGSSPRKRSDDLGSPFHGTPPGHFNYEVSNEHLSPKISDPPKRPPMPPPRAASTGGGKHRFRAVARTALQLQQQAMVDEVQECPSDESLDNEDSYVSRRALSGMSSPYADARNSSYHSGSLSVDDDFDNQRTLERNTTKASLASYIDLSEVARLMGEEPRNNTISEDDDVSTNGALECDSPQLDGDNEPVYLKLISDGDEMFIQESDGSLQALADPSQNQLAKDSCSSSVTP